MMNIRVSSEKNISQEKIIALYKANQWSAAKKPETLYRALLNSHTLITAWDNDTLVGLGNAISDGYLVVYFPHLLVLPSYQKKGVGKTIMSELMKVYKGFHMQMLSSDHQAIAFYEKMGFSKAGDTQAMWIYDGKEH